METWARSAGAAAPRSGNRTPRGSRVLRGLAVSAAATLFAAASHALAGGSTTALAVLATWLLALPLCALLAGRLGSLWRLSIAVTAAQFLYHWCFAGLGVASAAAPLGPMPAHAEHLRALAVVAPRVAEAGAADALMWLAHAAAAGCTVALLHRGERALLALLRLVRRVLPTRPRIALAFRAPAAAAAPHDTSSALLPRIFVPSAITHRGPPALA